MIAILGGLGAALLWSISTVASYRSSKLIGPTSATAWMMLVGLVVVSPIALLGPHPARLGGASVAWLTVAGVGNVLGLILEYVGFRFGYVSIVATLASTEGAVAAMLAIVAGEQIAPGVAGALGLIIAGIVAVGAARSGGDATAGVAGVLSHRPALAER